MAALYWSSAGYPKILQNPVGHARCLALPGGAADAQTAGARIRPLGGSGVIRSELRATRKLWARGPDDRGLEMHDGADTRLQTRSGKVPAARWCGPGCARSRSGGGPGRRIGTAEVPAQSWWCASALLFRVNGAVERTNSVPAGGETKRQSGE
ncbi:hypothetical protein NDU88_004798 [Pleurodeles waltl]|uniref:Uncharacterized protein n=1 Tax=Pleurodeles waltl TaxID=8319 RepID=A0AAV7UK40_PLEWA|nr:hypothetical protein NDU88_004798 [Pleurodeles waltl]